MCLGGLFVPEAYITATRQYVAQANSWSLEELCLEVNVTTSQSAALDACSFGVTGEWGVWRPSPLSELLAHAPRAGLQGGPARLLAVPGSPRTVLPPQGVRGGRPPRSQSCAVGRPPRPMASGRAELFPLPISGLAPPPGLKLQGATCSNNKLSLSNAISTVLPLTQLRWVKQTNAERKASVVSGGHHLGARVASPAPCPRGLLPATRNQLLQGEAHPRPSEVEPRPPAAGSWPGSRSSLTHK